MSIWRVSLETLQGKRAPEVCRLTLKQREIFCSFRALVDALVRDVTI
jgi:hypothetical protein